MGDKSSDLLIKNPSSVHLIAEFGRNMVNINDRNMKTVWRIWFPIVINAMMSIIAYTVTIRVIPRLKSMFIKANLFGIDLSKRTSDKV